MANLSAARSTPKKVSCFDQLNEFEMATGKAFWQGGIVAIDATGKLVPAGDATALVVVGMACRSVASAAAGEMLKVEQGIFGFDISGTGTLTDADRFQAVYLEDDHTVSNATTGLYAGTLYDIEGTIAWVLMVPGLILGAAMSAARVIAGGAAYTVTNADLGATVETATDNAVITLPDITAASKGKTIRVRNTAAAGAALVSISPHSSDKIVGSISNAAADVSSGGVADKDWRNTKATAKQADWTLLTSNGVDTWYITGGQGVWASEP